MADLIRLNQLVRGRINFEGFEAWFASLLSDQRRALTCLLCEFAHQAGVGVYTWHEAMTASGLPTSDPVVQRVLAAGRCEHPVFPLYDLVSAVTEEEMPTVFRLFVYLFGIAEGAVYRNESKEDCNHWWHRDLQDERVVRDLLTDTRFYLTSMRDDDRIKGRT